jgi:anthranilate/para-aminobenzoate synthase component I
LVGNSQRQADIHLEALLSRPAEARPVALEGRWLDGAPDECWIATDPASMLEGSGDALRELPVWLGHHSQRYPDGAAIGFLSYELARHFEILPLATHRSLPDVSFAYYPRVERLRTGATRTPRPQDSVRIASKIDFKMYGRAVERIRSYIAAGDIYQANLTIPFCAELGAEPPESIYLRMRGSGAPFRVFMKTPERTILSNSPERFFRVTGIVFLPAPSRELSRATGAITIDPRQRFSPAKKIARKI